MITRGSYVSRMLVGNIMGGKHLFRLCQIFDAVIMKAFRRLGNINYSKFFLISSVVAVPIYLHTHASASVKAVETDSDERLRDLEQEVLQNTSGKEWERRGMSIR